MGPYEVFTPTGVPTVTYIDREGQNLEHQLRSAIKTPGLIVSLSGPSKSGKTVLVNKIIPVDDLIAVSGAAITSADKLWERVLNWMESPTSTSSTKEQKNGFEGEGKLSAKAGVIFASAETEGSLKIGLDQTTAEQKTFGRGGVDQVILELSGSDFVVFIDDFHYMARETQVGVSRQIKEAAEKGVHICTASVPHRADDVVRSNPELRGRVKAIDFEYWQQHETAEIARRGFKKLGIRIGDEIIESMASEAFGSPQLMQQICLQTCLYYRIDDSTEMLRDVPIQKSDLQKIFEQTSTTTDFSSLLDALHAGPKHRGTSRSQYNFSDGSSGDVYRCTLLAIKDDPPILSFSYDEIYQRTRRVCPVGPPSGSSVAQALDQINSIGEAMQPLSRVIEWADDVLDIVDPYFLYYLRCSARLQKLKRM